MSKRLLALNHCPVAYKSLDITLLSFNVKSQLNQIERKTIVI